MDNYVKSGGRMTWTNGGSAVVSGQLVRVGNILAVACGDIAGSAEGELATQGVYTLPKVSGAVIAQGETLTWDASAAAFDDNAATPATGDVTGASAVAWEAAGNGVTELQVMLTGVPGTVA